VKVEEAFKHLRNAAWRISEAIDEVGDVFVQMEEGEAKELAGKLHALLYLSREGVVHLALHIKYLGDPFFLLSARHDMRAIINAVDKWRESVEEV